MTLMATMRHDIPLMEGRVEISTICADRTLQIANHLIHDILLIGIMITCLINDFRCSKIDRVKNTV